MNQHEKLLNDYLFAPARYLDKNGHAVDSNRLHKFVSAPETKAGIFFSATTAFALAAIGAGPFSFTPLIAGAVYTTLNIVDPPDIFNPVKNVPDYYFDTAPEESLPIGDPDVLLDLLYKRDSLKIRLLASTSSLAIAGPILYGIYHLVGMDPTSNLKMTSLAVAVSAAVNFTSRIATAWRAAQALDGNWNILTQKPDAEIAREETPVLSPAPMPTRN